MLRICNIRPKMSESEQSSSAAPPQRIVPDQQLGEDRDAEGKQLGLALEAKAKPARVLKGYCGSAYQCAVPSSKNAPEVCQERLNGKCEMPKTTYLEPGQPFA